MDIQERERSIEDSQPIRCYEFARGVLRWLYTSADRDIVIQNKLFRTGYQIQDSGFSSSGQSSTDKLQVTLAADAEVSKMYRALAPSDEITLVIWEYEYGIDGFLVGWVGSIENVKWPTQGSCEIQCGSIASSLDRPGLTMGWQRPCPYTLYDHNCKVDELAYRVSGTVQIVSGIGALLQQASEYPDNWFSGGYLEWDIGQGVMERRGIRRHEGDQLLILGGIFGLATGTVVDIYPGCFRTVATCHNKFNNLPNYGGHPHLPGKSPFDGTPIF